MSGVAIPEEISGLNVAHLNELSQCREALEGLWESSDTGGAIFNEQIEKANANIAKAEQTEAKAVKVNEQRKEVARLAAQSEEKLAEWQAAEAAMLSAIEPFTQPRLVRRLEMERDEAQALSDSLKTAVMEGDMPLNLFCKQYKENQTTLRRYEHLLGALN